MKQFPVRETLTTGLVLACIAGIAGTAQAAPKHNCAAYASAAVAQNNQNKAMGCGFKSRRWQSNYQKHLNWCKKSNVGIMAISKEDHARKSALQQCGNKTSFCNGYAQKAVNAYASNLGGKCGFKGRRWQANYKKHFNWCMKVKQSSANSETKKREFGISSCIIGDGSNLPKP
jgi:hypothetical protein